MSEQLSKPKVKRLLHRHFRHQTLLVIFFIAMLFVETAGFLLYLQVHTLSVKTTLTVASLIDASDNVSLEYANHLAMAEKNAPFEIAVFNRELKQIAGKPFSPKGLILRDLRFAATSNIRINNQKKGYSIIPKSEKIVLIMAPMVTWGSMFSNKLLWSVASLLVIGIIIWVLSFLLFRNYWQSYSCIAILHDLVPEAGNNSLDEQLQRIKHKIETLEADIKQCQAEKRDLNNQKKNLERLLRRTTQDLKTTQEHLLRAGALSALGEFAAGISHELNNPMGIVLGFTQHLLDDIEKDHPYYPMLKRMETELIRCHEILKDLLAFARPQEPNFKRVNINQLVQDTVNFVFYPGVQGIEVICNLQDELPDIVVDPEQLEQVLINLLKNSLDAIERNGSITVATSMVSLTHSGRCCDV